MIFGNFCVWSKCASSFFLLFFLFWSSFFSSFFFVRERERRTKHTVLISFFMVLRIAPYNTTKKKASFRALLFPQIETFHWSLPLCNAYLFVVARTVVVTPFTKTSSRLCFVKTRRVERRRRRFFCRRRTRRRTRRRKNTPRGDS